MLRTTTAVVAAVAAVVLGSAGCTASDTGTPDAGPTMLPSTAPLTVEGMDLTPQLDPVTGAVVLPLDRFLPTWEETDLLATAGSVSIALCAQERGVTFVAPEPAFDPIYLSEEYLGPWTVDQAERFAFVPPMTPADLVANGVVGASEPTQPAADVATHPNFSLTDADWETIDDCGASDTGRTFRDATDLDGPWTEQISAARDSVLDSDEARSLLDDLATCLSSRGLDPDPDAPWTPRGANGKEISETQVRLALDVVACKDETGFTEQMALLEARATVPVIAEFAAELIQQRQTVDQAVEEARALLAENADLMRPVP